MARGKSINLFLMDGKADGKIKAQITNWNGIAYKIPRELLNECKELDAFQQSGVYFLFGLNSVYVGQAEVRKNGKGIHQRIVDHETDKLKDVWDEVVIFTSKDNSLGRTDISYLENRFYNKATEAKRYQVHNSNEPTMGTVTEEKESELEEFIDQTQLILGALGYKVFTPVLKIKESGIDKPTFQVVEQKQIVPPLPDADLKIGKFIQAAMKNLSDSGFVFTDKAITEMCSKEWSNKTLGLHYPFMRICDTEDTSVKDEKGYVRFYKTKYSFGKYNVYISKEWFGKDTTHYSGQDIKFIDWYQSLG